MANIPEEEEREPSRVTRVGRAIAADVARYPRVTFLMALAAAISSLAPSPLDALGAMAWVLVAVEVARKR